jgi:hypothetical protein
MFVQESIARRFSVVLGMVFVLAVTLAIMPLQAAHAVGPVRFAKPDGTGDCSSWVNACTLQTALTGAASGQEIWAAAGVYTPTTVTTNRNATFQLVSGVAVYGGFSGTETLRTQRVPAANTTILSGDIDNNDTQTPVITDTTTVTGNATNSYHVVTGANNATLDGFTITAGNANTLFAPDNRGGGMYNNFSSPALTNVTFVGNAAAYGGGMKNQGSSPALTNVTFSGNTANYGGGMENMSSSPLLTNVTFSGNSATGPFAYGGGMDNASSDPVLTNVTFSGNSASDGGGIHNSGGSLVISNTILWGNTAINGAQIYDDGTGTLTVSDSVVEGDFVGGTHIITTTPLLGPLGNYGGATQTIPLQPGSSAIDTGNDADCPGTDQRGVTRPQGAHCDIGAYEVQTVLLAVPGGKTSGMCEGWANACELRYALISAVTGQEIWAAAGTYKPTTDTNRGATFQLKAGVALYGGFDMTETARTQRNAAANVTILSGDIDNNDTQTPVITDTTTVTGNATNSYHVVTGANNATLDGFTVTAGYADGIHPDNRGGGMFNDLSSPTVANVTFSGNYADAFGGGMTNDAGSPTLTSVTFSGNSTANLGGGMFNNNSKAVLTNVTFSDNSATAGGGMGNSSFSAPTLTNVTFGGNSASSQGGGMYNYSLSTVEVRNTILWGNTAASTGAQIWTDSDGSSANVSYSVVEGGYLGGTNITTTNPLLGPLGNYGGATQTLPLQIGSSAIDTGDEAVCPATDQRGVTRPQGGHCDIGAYEARIYSIYLPLVVRF